jgi:hypothetical protein
MDMITFETKAQDLHTNTVRKYVSLALDWCEINLGYHPFKRYRPHFSVHSKGPEFFMGRYIPWLDKIEIFKNEHETLEGIIKTAIHEYTHHTQNMFEYRILLNQVGYSSNPLEIEARENEKRWLECWRYIITRL